MPVIQFNSDLKREWRLRAQSCPSCAAGKAPLETCSVEINMVCAVNGIPERIARDAGERDRLRGLWDKREKKHRKQMWCEKPSAKDYFTICHLLSVLVLNHSCLSQISHYHFFYHVLFGNFSSVPECLLHISWVFKLLWGIWVRVSNSILSWITRTHSEALPTPLRVLSMNRNNYWYY